MEIFLNIVIFLACCGALYEMLKPRQKSIDEQALEMFQKKVGTISVYVRLTREQYLRFLPIEPTELAPAVSGLVMVAHYNLMSCIVAETPDEHNPDEYSRTGICYLNYEAETVQSLAFSEHVLNHFDDLIGFGAFKSILMGSSDPMIRLKISQENSELQLPVPLMGSIQDELEPDGDWIQLVGGPAEK